MELKELHEEYGRLMIQLEILQNKVLDVKRKIAEKMGGRSENRNTDDVQRVGQMR